MESPRTFIPKNVFLVITLLAGSFCLAHDHGRGTGASNVDDAFDSALRENQVTVTDLKQTTVSPIRKEKKQDSLKLDLFCYQGSWPPMPNRILQSWSSVNLRLIISSEDYELFTGENRSMVYHEFEQASRSLVRWMPSWTADTISLSPFNETCIGIKTMQDYKVKLVFKTIEIRLICLLGAGILLFLCAGKLSKNIIFYYGTGISIGVIASLLIVIFIVSRFIPWKKGAYIVMFGGWSIILGGLLSLNNHIRPIIEHHGQYVLAYLILSALISFAVCYYYGPVSNPRSLNLIKWSIQGISVCLIFLSCWLPEVSLTIVLTLVFSINVPRRIYGISYLRNYIRKRFPPKPKLLTENEYMQQSDEATRKALKELREYCRSPDCDAWKTISRLKSPQRFASWVEGESHLSEDEFASYIEDPNPSFTEDESEDEIDFRLNSL